MAFELSIFGGSFNQALIQKQAVNEVMKCNDLTMRFGLALTEPQAVALVETRSHSLKQTGRIEFGGGIIDKIITEFCDSPYISMRNYEQVLHELVEVFYYYKNETLDIMSDDDLISYMENAFDGVCQGSLELLSGRELDKLARNLRFGFNAEHTVNIPDADKGDEDGEC